MSKVRDKSVGIDISDRSIEIVELGRNNGSQFVVSRNRAQFKAGIVENGMIKNADKLSAVITALLAGAHPNPVNTDLVVFGMPDQLVYTLMFDIGSVDREKTTKIIAADLESTIPISKADLEYSYGLFPMPPAGAAGTEGGRKAVVLAASKKAIAEWRRLFSRLGFKIVKSAIGPTSALRGLETRTLEMPFCLVDIGEHSTNVSMIDNSGLRYGYMIYKAGDYLTKRIAGEKGITFARAEKIKKEFNISDNNDKPSENIINDFLSELMESLNNNIEYYNAKQERAVKKIILCGGTSALKGIVARSRHYAHDLTVERALPRFKELEPIYLNAAGLAVCGLEGEKGDVFPFESEANIPSKIESSLTSVMPKINLEKLVNRIKKNKIIIGAAILLLIGAAAISIFRPGNGYRSTANDNQTDIVLPAVDTATNTGEASVPGTKVRIKPISGSLNVRQGPGTQYQIVSQVSSLESYVLLDENDGWYEIRLNESLSGWVSGDFAEKIKTAK